MYRSLITSIFLIFFLSCQSTSDHVENLTENDKYPNDFGVSNVENYAKQVILACNKADLKNVDSLMSWVTNFKPGGLLFKNWPIENIQSFANGLDSLMETKPLFLVDYFETVNQVPYPIWSANSMFQDSCYWFAFMAANVNLVSIPEIAFKQTGTGKYLQRLKGITGIMPCYQVDLKNRTLASFRNTFATLHKKEGMLWVDSVKVDSLPYHKIKKELNWKGLIIATPLGNHLSHLAAGADMVVVPNKNLIDKFGYQQTRQTKNAYKGILNFQKHCPINRFRNISASSLLKATKLHYNSKSTVHFNSTKLTVPFKKFRYVSINKYLSQKGNQKRQLVEIPDKISDSILVAIVKNEQATKTLFVFSNPLHYQILDSLPNLIFNPKGDIRRNKVLQEQLAGKIGVNGNLIVENRVENGIVSTGTGLSNLPAEYAFIDSKVLGGIRNLVSSAIEGKAFPGCQVLAVKDNVVIYNKAFGHTNYLQEFSVNTQNLYDLASLTKVLATTLVAMKLWEDGHFKLDDKLGQYLPDTLNRFLPNGSTLKDVTFQELLTHQSGLPAGFPVIEYMRKAADLENRFTNGFCDYPYTNFQTEVAKDLYLENTFQDSMWLRLNTMWIDPSKPYKYSDVNMNLLYFILKRIIEQNNLAKRMRGENNAFVKYLYLNFYRPLGMKTTQYLPLKKYAKNRIVPTENDRFWRKQQLQGHVHDPNAALYGGVAGNAGLFSNASDIGLLLTMWQNKGVFMGQRYLKAATIMKFIETQPNSHRGLGFNKRTFTNSAYAMAESADVSSYGHTGFTGTCFWVDPVSKISYVFLSNRVHPIVSRKIYEFNIRTRVHQVFYDARLK